MTASDRDSALEAVTAGVDMEMAGDVYISFLEDLVEKELVSIETIDNAVANVIRVKLQLGLFANPYTVPDALPPLADKEAFEVARAAALQSVVMLTNESALLPLSVDDLS